MTPAANRRRALVLGVVVAAAGPTVARAQPQAAVEFLRERSAQEYGRVIAGETIVLAPLARGPGVVFVQPFSYSGSARLHFQITAPPLTGEWEIRIVDQGKVLWSTSKAEETEPRFWSDEVMGRGTTLEIHTTAAAAGFQLAVDKVAVAAGARFVNQATTPPRDCKAPIDSMTAPQGQGCQPIDAGVAALVRSWAPSVARLRLVAADDKLYYCSGFLITSELLLTNWHCVQSIEEMRATRVDFDYDTPGVKPVTLRLKEWIAPSRTPFDFVVVRLSAAANRPRLRLIDRAPGSSLVVIQHPDGLAKHVSIEDCKVTNPSVPGVDKTMLTDFGHFCDTLGGSSGSPVLDAGTGEVVGLHHLGFKKGSSTPYNQAVSIGQVLAEIQAQRPDIRLEIQNANP